MLLVMGPSPPGWRPAGRKAGLTRDWRDGKEYRRQPTGRPAGLILASEAVFGLVYLYFVGLPAQSRPVAALERGRKMLEIGFLNAIVRAFTSALRPYFAEAISITIIMASSWSACWSS
jgi:hypothetical protein